MRREERLQFYLNNISCRKTEIYKISKSVLCSHEAAEDLTQTVLEKAWQNLDALQNEEKVWAWVKGIIRNEIRTYIKAQKKYRRYFNENDPEQFSSIEFMENSTYLAERDILELFIDRENKEMIVAAFLSLDEREQSIIGLHLIAEMTLKDIADMLDMPYGSVRVFYSRSLKKLKEAYFEVEARGNGYDK